MSKSKSSGKTLFRRLGLGVLLLSTAVAAQPTEPAPPAPSLPANAPTAGEAAPVTALTPQLMAANSRTYRERMDDIEQRIEVLLAQSKKKRDIIKINCLTDKLVQVRANILVADKSFVSLQQELGDDNEAAAFTDYRRIAVANLNVQVMGTEAEACVGEDLSVVGVTRIDVESEGVPSGDPTQPIAPSAPSNSDLGRPPHASPYF